MDSTLSEYVDIGGECFNVTGTMNSPPANTNSTKTYDLFCKSASKFNEIFGKILVPGDIRLIRTYLPYQQPQLQNIQEHEKAPLIRIIQARIDMIKASIDHIKVNNTSIANMEFVRILNKLEKLLVDIGNATLTTSKISLTDLKNKVKSNFKKEKVYYILMELAWRLLHPDTITTKQDQWSTLLDTVKDLDLGKIVESIHNSNKYTMMIDMDRVEKFDEIGKAMSPPDESVELKKRLESILQLFVMRKYLKEPLVNDKTIDTVKSKLPYSMMGGGNTKPVNTTPVSNSIKINNESMASMMKPFYTFFKQKYDPITSVLSSPLPDGLTLVSLSKLLFICQKITSQPPGIYRMTNMDAVMIEFLRTQLGSVQAYVNDASRTDDDRKLFTEMARAVPVVSITTLLNRHNKLGHYVDPDTVSIVRIMIMGMNLEFRNDTGVKSDDTQLLDIAVKEVFTDQGIYLVCNQANATQTPMNVFEVNYTDVNVSKDTWTPTKLDRYFKVDKNPPLFLETVMDVKSDIVFNNGMIAVKTFIASEDLLPN
jgi:hypothetical protein